MNLFEDTGYEKLMSALRLRADKINATTGKALDISIVKVGQVLENRYQVLKVLSVTNYSQVFEAWDERLEQKVAIKFIYLPEQNDQAAKELRKSLKREGHLLAAIKHTNIVKVYNVIDNPPGLVLEWVDGISLYELLDKRRVFSVSEVIRVGIAIADALSYTHERGIIHRNVTPSNIILNASNEPILVDFNIAHVLNRDTIALEKDGKSYYVGTLSYSAPEQITSPESVSAAVDVFALGIVLYELLTLENPFVYGNWPRNYEQGLLPAPDQRNIPEKLYKVLCQTLNQYSNKRPTASALRENLKALQY